MIQKFFYGIFLIGKFRWNNVKNNCGKLTKETFGALMHTMHALLEIADYCFNELGAKYILLGKFQTDSLESRFGQYRQLAGGKYDVSLRQVYECEKKIRLLTILKLKLNGVVIHLSDFSLNWDLFESDSVASYTPLPITVTKEDISSSSETIPVITYIAGYCCYSINKKLKCEECKLLITSTSGDDSSFNNSLIKGLNRGSLLYPSMDIVNIAQVSYIVIQKLSCLNEFLRAIAQRDLAIKSILAALVDEILMLEFADECPLKHEPTKLIKMAAYTCCNILLNNFCFLKNDVLGAAKLAKRRKLQTLN